RWKTPGREGGPSFRVRAWIIVAVGHGGPGRLLSGGGAVARPVSVAAVAVAGRALLGLRFLFGFLLVFLLGVLLGFGFGLAALLAQALQPAFQDLADQVAVLDAGGLGDQAQV